MIFRPFAAGESARFCQECRWHFLSMWDQQKLCCLSNRLPEPSRAIIVEIRDSDGEYIAHHTFHHRYYRNHAELFDAPNLKVFEWRGWSWLNA